MAHHKRSKPKSGRAGCLLCKPHKRQGAPLADRQKHSQWRRIVAAEADMDAFERDRETGPAPQPESDRGRGR